MRLGIDLQCIADAMRECSCNMAFAVGFCAVAWLIGTLWKWRA